MDFSTIKPSSCLKKEAVMSKNLKERKEIIFAPGEKTYGLKIFREECVEKALQYILYILS